MSAVRTNFFSPWARAPVPLSSHPRSSAPRATRATGRRLIAVLDRLKLKCDKKIPCGSCVRRGCTSICPNGACFSLWTHVCPSRVRDRCAHAVRYRHLSLLRIQAVCLRDKALGETTCSLIEIAGAGTKPISF